MTEECGTKTCLVHGKWEAEQGTVLEQKGKGPAVDPKATPP